MLRNAVKYAGGIDQLDLKKFHIIVDSIREALALNYPVLRKFEQNIDCQMRVRVDRNTNFVANFFV